MGSLKNVIRVTNENIQTFTHLKMPWPAKLQSTKLPEISDISDSDLSDEEAIDAKPMVKSNAQPRSQMEELESWMNLNDVPTNLPRATSSDVGAFIENGEIFGYLFSLLPEPVQYVCNATNSVIGRVCRVILKVVWFFASIIFNLVTNFLPYLLLTMTTLSQSNELLTRGILLGVVKSDKKLATFSKTGEEGMNKLLQGLRTKCINTVDIIS